ncbi:hypothetical protein CCHR01_00092 [Colletotrichum chrysophilum]|uniref:Uncharacterized protein n=1 Tax=Colletotrichum chrysophilum TaxID=1836956 RepID=A0AAD9EUN0_9PEZI|nr:hypothetical protein CCHR01_00092 [Colletotrichum chrysophilum]
MEARRSEQRRRARVDSVTSDAVQGQEKGRGELARVEVAGWADDEMNEQQSSGAGIVLECAQGDWALRGAPKDSGWSWRHWAVVSAGVRQRLALAWPTMDGLERTGPCDVQGCEARGEMKTTGVLKFGCTRQSDSAVISAKLDLFSAGANGRQRANKTPGAKRNEKHRPSPTGRLTCDEWVASLAGLHESRTLLLDRISRRAGMQKCGMRSNAFFNTDAMIQRSCLLLLEAQLTISGTGPTMPRPKRRLLPFRGPILLSRFKPPTAKANA